MADFEFLAAETIGVADGDSTASKPLAAERVVLALDATDICAAITEHAITLEEADA